MRLSSASAPPRDTSTQNPGAQGFQHASDHMADMDPTPECWRPKDDNDSMELVLRVVKHVNAEERPQAGSDLTRDLTQLWPIHGHKVERDRLRMVLVPKKSEHRPELLEVLSGQQGNC